MLITMIDKREPFADLHTTRHFGADQLCYLRHLRDRGQPAHQPGFTLAGRQLS